MIPHRWRASCFGLLFCGFFIGFALAPFLAIPLSHYEVSLLSLGLQAFGFLYGLLFLPETLSKETSEETRRIRKEANEADLAAYMAGNNGILLTNESDNNLDNTQIIDHCFSRQCMLVKRIVGLSANYLSATLTTTSDGKYGVVKRRHLRSTVVT